MAAENKRGGDKMCLHPFLYAITGLFLDVRLFQTETLLLVYNLEDEAKE